MVIKHKEDSLDDYTKRATLKIALLLLEMLIHSESAAESKEENISQLTSLLDRWKLVRR